MLKAVTRQAARIDARIQAINSDPSTDRQVSTAYFFDHHAIPDDIAVVVSEDDFMAAHRELVPSVSAGELSHYERVRDVFEGGKAMHKLPPSVAAQSATGDLFRESVTPGLGSKGKGKIMGSLSRGKGATKGKGKALATDSDDELGDHEGDESLGLNGPTAGKGKASSGFRQGTASDDDGMY
jgi:peroxin-6